MNEVINAIKSRRSVRAYKNANIGKDVLQAIVEVGYYAPTGHNGQPWHFAVVQDSALIAEVNAETKKKMAQVPVDWIRKAAKSPRPVTHDAPALIIVSSKKGYVTGRDDCTAALDGLCKPYIRRQRADGKVGSSRRVRAAAGRGIRISCRGEKGRASTQPRRRDIYRHILMRRKQTAAFRNGAAVLIRGPQQDVGLLGCKYGAPNKT